MKNKIIKYLQEEKRAINVRSEEEWIELMYYFEFYDIEWIGNDKAISYVDFKRHEEESSITLGFFKKEKLGYSDNDFNKSNGYTIVLFQDFKKEFIEKDLTYQLHLAIKRVDELEKRLREETTKYYAIFKLEEKDFNYLNYDDYDKDYFISSKTENEGFKSKFTQKELQDLNVWDKPLFEIEEVK